MVKSREVINFIKKQQLLKKHKVIGPETLTEEIFLNVFFYKQSELQRYAAYCEIPRSNKFHEITATIEKTYGYQTRNITRRNLPK